MVTTESEINLHLKKILKPQVNSHHSHIHKKQKHLENQFNQQYHNILNGVDV